MPENSGSVTDVVRLIIELIRKNEMTVGDRLPSIRDMSQMWGIGRNMVRDGLQKAQSLGIVRILPRSGAFVSSFDLSSLVEALTDTIELSLMQEDSNILHLINARRVIECALVELAAQFRRPEDLVSLRDQLELMKRAKDREEYVKADEQFHLVIGRMAGNPALQAVLRALLVLLRPYRMRLLPDQQTRDQAERIHEQLYAAIRDGESSRAKELIEQHLYQPQEKILAELKSEKRS